jgi:D-tyrosyl-tRNA(Tyr) deacylase
MRLVIQRVKRASVTVDGETIASISSGLLVLCGVGRDDTAEDASRLAGKTARLRIFEDADGKMNLDLRQAGGAVLAVSQFTLLGDCRKGNRPSFVEAADPVMGEQLYEAYVTALRDQGIAVQTGRFRTMM